MLGPVPSLAILEKYTRELQHSWLTGKIYPLWDHKALSETIPSPQVIRLILFQVDVHFIKLLYDVRLWDTQDGLVLERLGQFLFQAHEKIAIPHVQIGQFLHQALYQSLLMLLRPEDSLYNYFFQHRKALNLKEFAFYSQYVVYFDFVPAALLSYAYRQGLQVIDEALWREKFGRIIKVYEEETQESIERYQQRCLEEMVRQSWERIQERWQALAAAEEEVIGSILSSGDEDKEVLKNLFGTGAGPLEGGRSETARRNPLLSAVEYEPRAILAARFQERPRRADVLRRFELDAIPAHKQFLFIQRLFDGDVEAFNQVIEQLNSAKSATEAQVILSRWLPEKGDPKVREEFRQWVLSRFSEK